LQRDSLKRAGCDKIIEDTAGGGKVQRSDLDRVREQLRHGDILAVWRRDRLEWLDSSASQIQGTSAPAVADRSPVASRARVRKASTLSAAGASPSKKSLRSGARGGRAESGLSAAGGKAGSWESGLLSPKKLVGQDQHAAMAGPV